MITITCSIYDQATNAYMRPFMAQTVGQAVREFQNEVLRPESAMGKHKEDYALFQVGTFDDQNGLVEAIEPRCLRRAHEIETEQ